MSYYRDQLEEWLLTIDVPAGARVLDIGGAAKPVFHRLENLGGGWESYEVLDRLIEPPAEDCRYFKGDIHDIDFKTYALFQKSAGLPESKFTDIFCLEVAEYLYDPLRALKNIATYLVDDGMLYMSFPLIYPIHNPKEYDCLRYTRYGIEKLLWAAGFQIEQIIGREARDGDKLIDFYKSDGMHVAADSTITGYLVKAIKI